MGTTVWAVTTLGVTALALAFIVMAAPSRRRRYRTAAGDQNPRVERRERARAARRRAVALVWVAWAVGYLLAGPPLFGLAPGTVMSSSPRRCWP